MGEFGKKLKKMKKQDEAIVLVEWLDSVTRHDVALPLSEATKEKPLKAKTVGWILHKDEEKAVLCSLLFPSADHYDETGYKTIHIIPASSIIGIKTLEVKT